VRLASYDSVAGLPEIGFEVETTDGPKVAHARAAASATGHAVSSALRPALVTGDLRQVLEAGREAMDELRRLHAAVAETAGTVDGRHDLVDAGVLAAAGVVSFRPVVPRPGKVVCVGKNYADHVAEADDERPERPAAFAKFASSLIGHEQTIRYPNETAQLDYEGELALVIGRPASRVSRADALAYVAGYTILNDISSRDVQLAEMKAGMLLLGKNAAAGSPLGPWLVTADEISDPQDLQLELSVNGATRQSERTDKMLYDCADLVAYWSQLDLEPGDVIATGTPSGVGLFRDPPEENLLRTGDVVEVTISKLGTLRNRVA
jgi:2-keto-4-pentenoate hydratase/2-oxohepta-3-ene-1,7-dioic acid hydratase in catechol pathway